MEPKRIAELLTKQGGRSIEVLANIFENPKRALETLDFLIRSPATNADSRKRYQDVRNALEAYIAEENSKK